MNLPVVTLPVIIFAAAFTLYASTAAGLSTSAPSTNNKQEVKFDRMVDELILSPEAIECIDSSKQRLLFKGVAAGVADPQIRNAFRIVYRDLAPIRVAGDLLFGQLSVVASEASERSYATKDTIVAETLAASRALFDLIDGDNSGGLDEAELLQSPELLAVIREDDNSDDYDDVAVVNRFMELADENRDGVISFVEFANAAATQPQLQLVDDALTAALLSSSSLSSNAETKKKRGAFGIRKSPDERFDSMLEQCLQWEERLGCGPNMEETECTVDVNLQNAEDNSANEGDDSRLLQVLKGSMIGARCEPLVKALRMCYMDYSPLRFGGDVIFKLLGRVVKTQIAKNE